jgi:hypothetical protein
MFSHHYFQNRFITLLETNNSKDENTLIEHKEVVIICEESGPINLSYNVILTTQEANTITNL